MATPRKKIEPAAVSRFARLRDEARAKAKKVEPYVFDETATPPVVIEAPNTVGKLTRIAAIFDADQGRFEIGNMMALFETLCGDAYPVIWPQIENEPIEVMQDLLDDINDHFGGILGGVEDTDVSGGA